MDANTVDRPTEAPQRPAPRGPRLPEIPGPLDTAKLAWRRLRKMSTALWLMFGLVVASLIATFVPQEPIIPSTVREWREGEAGPGAGYAAWFDRFDFFDVFGSWWFSLLLVLLFVSLTGCLVPRWRAFARNVRKPPVAGRNLERLSASTVIRTDLPPADALDAVEGVVAKRRFRRRRLSGEDLGDPARPAQLAAERGHWREGGSLVFHSSFYVLLIGVVIGQAFGFTGQINIPEGGAFSDTRIGYDLATPGRYFDLEDHRSFVVRLEEFEVSYFDGFVPAEYRSTISISEGGQEVSRGDVRVNHPFRHDGVKLYQARFGMAPRVVVRAGERVLFDEQVMLSDAGGSVWTGVAKVVVGDPTAPEPPPQVALELVFLPDAALTDEGQPYSASPATNNPRLVSLLHVGELGLERPVPASQLELDESTLVGPPAILGEGASADIADGALTVEFAELTLWSGFQVSHAPGRLILLIAGTLLLIGLIPSLYSYRRRVWAEASSDGEGTRVVLAGAALQRRSAFTDEFTDLTAEVRTALGASPEPVDAAGAAAHG